AESYSLGCQGQPVSNILLISRMDVAGFANINDYSHPGVRQSQGCRLRLPQFCPRAVRRVTLPFLEISQLNKEERERSLVPSPTPIFDHGRKQTPILASPKRLSVGLSLIPDCASDPEVGQRSDHGIE